MTFLTALKRKQWHTIPGDLVKKTKILVYNKSMYAMYFPQNNLLTMMDGACFPPSHFSGSFDISEFGTVSIVFCSSNLVKTLLSEVV